MSLQSVEGQSCEEGMSEGRPIYGGSMPGKQTGRLQVVLLRWKRNVDSFDISLGGCRGFCFAGSGMWIHSILAWAVAGGFASLEAECGFIDIIGFSFQLFLAVFDGHSPKTTYLVCHFEIEILLKWRCVMLLRTH
eukprot:TRINITY_DN96_c0_g1_i9.p1 TRINITY_DN96_c0_g1~~TRINITY_DN96_c0_g1_i9.p1  ORF type:complete len:135 (+),score=9.79 TRINITY_DN96_c0_g1_i9:619-1023(+)